MKIGGHFHTKEKKEDRQTPERKKAREVVARVHERIASRKFDFAHQISRQLVDRFGTIVFEDLKIKNMHKNHHLAKNIVDVAWNLFITIAETRAKEAGSRLILVNPGNRSWQCSRCDMIVANTLSNRVHSCPHRGLSMDRDRDTRRSILWDLGCNPRGSIPGYPDERGAVTYHSHPALVGVQVPAEKLPDQKAGIPLAKEVFLSHRR